MAEPPLQSPAWEVDRGREAFAAGGRSPPCGRQPFLRTGRRRRRRSGGAAGGLGGVGTGSAPGMLGSAGAGRGSKFGGIGAAGRPATTGSAAVPARAALGRAPGLARRAGRGQRWIDPGRSLARATGCRGFKGPSMHKGSVQQLICIGITASLCSVAPLLPASAQPASAVSSDDASAPEAEGEPARNITASGQTKPPGAPLGPAMGTSPKLREEHREIDEHTLKSICTGVIGCQ